MQAKPYLDYLDKEMSIMGILSSFAVALAALTFERAGSAKEGFLAEVWLQSRPLLLATSLCLVVAAALFYKQRSRLAWYYGQLALAETKTVPADNVVSLLDDADSWSTWLPYQSAFGCLWLAAVWLSIAVLGTVSAPIHAWPVWCTLGIPLAVLLLVLGVRAYVLTVYRFEEEPFHAFLRGRQRARGAA